ncbi:DinB family protein [Falsibacillus albus]|uniref:DinB family protein n=1 Tax=Falsibacillus albus TaxID=2478915 RepID=A0A3L7JY34_9BACI|nr:DinB family protein [Falsibacillus albus]RLQ94591.1 DinB family protein [Falsibacillus albus]
MQKVVERLNHWINVLPDVFSTMSEREISTRPSPTKWSKKEIVGHLCDSAVNNMARFINIQYAEQVYAIQTYDQEQWVAIQHYHDRPLEEIFTLFQSLNKQIAAIIENVPTEKLSNLCDIGNNEQRTLEWLIRDYLDHMEHHIRNQILI